MRRTLALLVVLILAAVIFLWAVSRFGGGVGDGGTDGNGSSSSGAANHSVAQGRELSCADGADNEGDGLTDCSDPDCSGNGACRCSLLSCGDSGEHTCAPEQGCYCNDADGCVACRTEDQTCVQSRDCCYGLGLECRQVRLTSGTTEMRCMPSERVICDIECTGDPATQTEGKWGRPESCGQAATPPGLEDCAELTGPCDLSPNAERNMRKCWKS